MSTQQADSLLTVSVFGGKPRSLSEASGFQKDVLYNACLGRLIYFNTKRVIRPGLVESFDHASEHKVWTLKLKAGLQFHHGRPVSAQDLVFGMTRYFYSSLTTPMKTLLAIVVGADEISEGTEWHADGVRGIKIKNALTVEITLKESCPDFLISLSDSQFSPVPKECFADDYVTWLTTFPIGAGSYRVISNFQNEYVLKCESLNTAENLSTLLKIQFGIPTVRPDLAVGFLENPFPTTPS